MSNVLKIAVLLFSILLQAQSVFAAEESCGRMVDKYDRFFQELLRTESPWAKYPTSHSKFIYYHLEAEKAIPVGYTPDELAKAGITLGTCKEIPSLGFIPGYKIKLDVMGPFQMLFLHDACTRKDDVLNRLVCASGQGTFIVGLPPGVLELADDPKLVARMMFHENFHSMQFSRPWKNIRDVNDFPEQCLNNKGWTSALKTELKQWKRVLAHWDSLSDDQLKVSILALLKNRQASQQECWNHVREFERVEGTAHHYEIEIARAAGHLDTKQVAIVDADYLRTNLKRNDRFFYGTGNWLCRALRRLSSDTQWQDKIADGGMSPEDAFREL